MVHGVIVVSKISNLWLMWSNSTRFTIPKTKILEPQLPKRKGRKSPFATDALVILTVAFFEDMLERISGWSMEWLDPVARLSESLPRGPCTLWTSVGIVDVGLIWCVPAVGVVHKGPVPQATPEWSNLSIDCSPLHGYMLAIRSQTWESVTLFTANSSQRCV